MRRTATLPTLAAVLALALGSAVTTVAPAPAAAQTAAPDTIGWSFLDDVELGARLVGRGLTAPLDWTAEQWLTIPAAAAVLAAVTTVDDDVEHFAETHQGRVGDAWFGTLEPFGQEYSIPLVIALYAGGAAFDRPGWRRTAVEAAAASVVAAGIITPTLKVVTGRARPRKEVGQYVFDPFSGSRSFPSGHTTQAFALASVFAAESDSWVVDVLVYGVAASVGGARIYHDAHFLSDVLAGAAIGTAVGHGMVRGGRELRGTGPFVGAVRDGIDVGVRLPFR